MALIQLDGSTDTDLFLSELSPPPDQDVTIQFSHGRFVPSDSLNPESGDHPDIAPFLNTEQHVSFFRTLVTRSVRQTHRTFPIALAGHSLRKNKSVHPFLLSLSHPVFSNALWG